MEPVSSWSEERVLQWLHGLDAPLHQYPVSDWRLTGVDLLQITSLDLEKLGVQKMGHQELLLDAVEKLCSLTYGLSGESLRGLAEKLRALAHTLQKGIQGRWRLNSYDGHSTTKLCVGVLQLVVELIISAKGLFSLLNRYQFFQLNQYSSTKHIFTSCRQLGEIVNNDSTVFEKEKDIISVGRQLVSVCDDILKSSSEWLLSHTAELESVHLVPAAPGDALGIEITSTNSTNHYVSGTALEPSADVSLRILAGDEVIQVNDQIVVGWSRANLVKKLKENPNGVTLVLKKVPGSKRRQNKTPELSVSKAQEEEESRSEPSDEEEDNPRHSIFERVAASVRSLSFRRAIQGPEGDRRAIQGPEGERRAIQGPEGDRRAIQGPEVGQQQQQQQQQQHMGQEESDLPSERRLQSLSAEGDFEGQEGFLSPRGRSPRRGSQGEGSFGSDMVRYTGIEKPKKSSTKGMSTAMSRRRVSCRELGRPDCDGWLWKKRRDSGVFVTQKWQRFWFILKGPALYWYNNRQDEKAEGFVNVSSYSIESAGEHKRKYVFKMCHSRFQNFFFAADHVNDMSKWINRLISSIHKHQKLQTGPASEEECYSETESESERSPSPGRRNKKVNYNTYPRKKDKAQKMPLPNPTEGGSKSTAGPVDEMGQMLNNIKEGGVSLMGQEQPFTHDHFRRSFIKRCKNPVMNEKVHTLRTLHSTLKAKEAELLQLNKVLDESNFSVAKYRSWKQHNEELLKEIQKLAAQRHFTDVPNKATSSTEVAMETMAATAPAQTEEWMEEEERGASRLMLSTGEQLVDAEAEGSGGSSPDPLDTSPKLEVNLGSLQESINQELSEMAETGETEHYFYI
ncbi:connector enhancer of kinase suppressor of ras 1 [Eucyclogobius newberryi]|uniref:connector enhancer of kinase suppressor of ras 1 n=1 Tax=Eucyclogobius newberryi TaxID=166745 RepID=UPI003B5C3459